MHTPNYMQMPTRNRFIGQDGKCLLVNKQYQTRLTHMWNTVKVCLLILLLSNFFFFWFMGINPGFMLRDHS